MFVTGFRRPRSILTQLLILVAAAVAIPSSLPAEPRQSAQETLKLAESQPRLVDRALDALKPATTGASEIYFVGFAG